MRCIACVVSYSVLPYSYVVPYSVSPCYVVPHSVVQYSISGMLWYVMACNGYVARGKGFSEFPRERGP